MSVEAIKTKSTEALKALQKNDFRHCFGQKKIRTERRIQRKGQYIEGKEC